MLAWQVGACLQLGLSEGPRPGDGLGSEAARPPTCEAHPPSGTRGPLRPCHCSMEAPAEPELPWGQRIPRGPLQTVQPLMESRASGTGRSGERLCVAGPLHRVLRVMAEPCCSCLEGAAHRGWQVPRLVKLQRGCHQVLRSVASCRARPEQHGAASGARHGSGRQAACRDSLPLIAFALCGAGFHTSFRMGRASHPRSQRSQPGSQPGRPGCLWIGGVTSVSQQGEGVTSLRPE